MKYILLHFLRIKSLQNELMEYNILENAIFIPISAKVGTNLDILKERILDLVLKQKEVEKSRHVEEDKRLELEREEKMNEVEKRRQDITNISDHFVHKNENEKTLTDINDNDNERESFNEVEKVEEKEVDECDEIYPLRNNSSSAGVLLDIIKSRKLGTALHVVIRKGEVRQNQHVLFHPNLSFLFNSFSLFSLLTYMLYIFCLYHFAFASFIVFSHLTKSKVILSVLHEYSHILLLFSKVQEGDYFAAGGWSGMIKRISHEDGDSTLTNRTFENGRVPVGRCGWGVGGCAIYEMISIVMFAPPCLVLSSHSLLHHTLLYHILFFLVI